MGALPKRRISTARKGRRRSDSRKLLTSAKPIACKSCGANKLSHTICAECNTY